MASVGIAVGSNLRPELHIPAALQRLDETPTIEVVATSRVYATPAIGPDGDIDDKPDFHNAVVLVATELGPLELRQLLRQIESDLGRHRTSDRYAARPIDLDIVFYDSVVVRTDDVEIPDPHALSHPHIVVPLADVAPEWCPAGQSTTAAGAAAHHTLSVVTRPGDVATENG